MKQLVLCAMAVCLASLAAQAEVMCDFEGTGYVAGQTFVGVDAWSDDNSYGNLFKAGTCTVTTSSLDGAQSGNIAAYSSSRRYIGLGWNAGMTWEDGREISMLVNAPAGSNFETYISNSLFGLTTPIGLTLNNGVIDAFGKSTPSAVIGSINTGMTYTPGQTLQIGYVVSPSTSTFAVFTANADGSNRTTSATYYFDSTLTASDVLDGGGLAFVARNGSSGTIDNIQTVVPEPVTLALLAFGVLGMRRRLA